MADNFERKKPVRMYEVAKRLRLQSHEFGTFCECKRLKCTEKVNSSDRQAILNYFNSLESNNEQNSYLCSLISVTTIQRRRSRAPENLAKYHDSSYKYRVRIKTENTFKEEEVCATFFKAVHGISKSKLEYLQSSLKKFGISPKDKRGGKNYKKMESDTLECIKSHIASFKTRQSHYSLKDNKNRAYLPEELNIKKMYRMFKDLFPNEKASYQSYRNIFRDHFNIGFGYPRSDTCSQCDQFSVKIKAAEKGPTSGAEVSKLNVEKELHLRKAQTFYDRKAAARNTARRDIEFEAISMDYQKNISLPNISTNDVYYKRQLSMFSFNIHVLSNSQSYFYTYPEYIAKKGADEVCSFLFDFCMNFLPREVKNLHIFCDAAGGQNKNYTLVRFTHYMVNVIRRLDSIKLTYPVRGHSYLECDKNMGLINTKLRMESPGDWEQNIAASRVKPTPFNVVSVDQSYVKEWTEFFSTQYSKKCPFPIQKMREFKVTNGHVRLISHRDSYNGAKLESPILSEEQCDEIIPRINLKSGTRLEFKLPSQSYFELIPMDTKKHKDLMSLLKFCQCDEVKQLYASLPHAGKSSRKRIGKAVNQAGPSQQGRDKIGARIPNNETSSRRPTRKSAAIDVDRADHSHKQDKKFCAPFPDIKKSNRERKRKSTEPAGPSNNQSENVPKKKTEKMYIQEEAYHQKTLNSQVRKNSKK